MPKWFRRVISIAASDSPNVALGLWQRRAGLEADHRQLVPGILTLAEYDHRRATWDPVRACVGLDANFWEGSSLLLFPPAWIDEAERLFNERRGMVRKARAIGIDPAEGGDQTAMCAVDEWGIVELCSKQTPDTSVIETEALAFWLRHGVDPSNVVFDQGGGGKQIADLLRRKGHKVRSVSFGGKTTIELRAGRRQIQERREVKQDQAVYENLRAQMYAELSILMDPSLIGRDVDGIQVRGFAIAPYLQGNPQKATTELRHQMAPIPKLYSPLEKMYLPPKNKPKNAKDGDGKEIVTLISLCGHSPDELDSVVLGVHGMLHKAHVAVAGAVK